MIGRTLLSNYGGPALAVTLLEPGIARIRFAPTGAFAPRRSWSPVAPDDAFDRPPATVASGDGSVEVSSDQLTVRAERDAGRVTVLDRASGQVLVSDGADGGPAWDPATGAATWTRRMPPEVHYFGLGERTDLLDKRGRRHTFWNTDRFEGTGPGTDELYKSIPFYLAMDGAGRCHGVYLNNTHRTVFDLTDERGERLAITVDGGELDQYILAGPRPADVVARYTALTGRMSLPPRWALGYHHSRFGYDSAERFRRVAARLRADLIPTDVLYLDIDVLHSHRDFTWDPERFPDPAGLIRALREQGFKTVLVIDPGVAYQPEGGYDVFTEGEQRGYFLCEGDHLLLRYVWPGLCAFPDFLRDDVRDWWAGWHDGLIASGVRGLENDMNEPSMRDRPIWDPQARRVDPPPETPHGPPHERATHAEVHNIYANAENLATSEALRRNRPGERPLLLSRAGFAGLQRHAASWTGDNASFWEHLEMSVPQVLNLGLCGLAFVGADIGGFFADAGPELLARWYQLGAFYPLARANNNKGCADQEPWVWGERIEAVCRRALELRYRLLPYLYTVFEEAARTGSPVLRPLLYHYGDDSSARLRHDQALVGADLMIAPVLRPGRTARDVYLPEGRWYDLRTGAVADGPADVLTDAPLDAEIPVYARGGAIIPFGPDQAFVDERTLDPLTLAVYPDRHDRAGGALYEDDGISVDGAASTTRYEYRDGTVTARRSGGYAPGRRRVVVRVPGRPERVRYEDSASWELAM
ncbi:glycoside hydrolase family 31 protein [Planosporangium flavigriseum]|uniref:Alpha-glucosidase n=1 Tax=Planosporangium flavigriseum TaxID=373681 RepID=A0A8J3LMR3_9ACTN|nr:glycoside hydrolase family 31 protein [Planosporangium flavigriseum]NJC66431.1 glycoside hydrolase family 31 protein [Planosporangium flavigriseum]GIG74159.1 alpha-glucosidase [Planosporangium flavigriseum]